MKKRLIFILLLLFVCLLSCEKSAPITPVSSETEKIYQTHKQETEETPEVVPVEKTEPHITTKPAEIHVHKWSLFSSLEATCTANGMRVYVCSCGEKKEEVLLSFPHDYLFRGCGNRFSCKYCGTEGKLAEHHFEKNVCSLCSLAVTSPIFVRNVQLNYDETVDQIIQKLGNPTEILSEGELKSLVYASDLSALTVVQTDSQGLWGVFTMDPTAFFYIDGQIVKAEGFSGKPDTQSDTLYRDLGSCRIYGFCDKLGTGKYYGMWMRYTECDYNYLTDPRIVQDYGTQERLSYYYVNALRAKGGMAALKWSAQAAQVSREYCKKMAEENFFNHDNLYGSRLNAAGVLWHSCGENISQGYTSAFFVCDAYYNCVDHRNNILNTSFTHVGMGYAMQTDGTYPSTVLGSQTFFS